MNGHTNARLKLAAALSLFVALAAAWAAAHANASAQNSQAQANAAQEARPAPQGQAGQPTQQQPPQENPKCPNCGGSSRLPDVKSKDPDPPVGQWYWQCVSCGLHFLAPGPE